MNLDIHTAVVTAVIVAFLGALLNIWIGARAIRKGRKVAYYRIRHQQVVRGWQTILLAAGLAGCGLLMSFFAEPVAYTYFHPSTTPSPTPTISLTPTITLTPTISLTPTITLTPVISDTPTITPTPFLPIAIEAQFVSIITPNPAAIFSPLKFSQAVNNFQAVNPQTVFQNPLKKMIVTYSYDGMLNGSQWTALWYRNGELVHYETGPWEGSTGGYGIAEWDPPAEEWLAGTYQVLFFVGTEWKTVGEFIVRGDPSTPTLTRTATISPTPSRTPTVTRTPLPSWTPRPTDTRWPTPTPVK